MGWLNLVSLGGIVALGILAWLSGGCPRRVPWRTVIGSALLMLAMGAIVFWAPPARRLLLAVNDAVIAALHAANAGAEFLFGPLAVGPGRRTAAGEPSVGFVLAAQVLPAVVFFAALMAALYHLRLIQPLVRMFGRLFHRALGLSGAEALAGSSNVFFGVESAAMVRPYLDGMTRSELLTVLTCGMATVASTTLAIYVLFLQAALPNIAGHLISASFLSIPAAALVSKLILPESATTATSGAVPPTDETPRHANVVAALTSGAWDGLRLTAGIAALLIAVLGVVGLLDLALRGATAPFAAALGGPIDIERVLGWVFTPLAALLGIEAADVAHAGAILGSRAVVTEVVAYRRLADLAAAGAVSPRTVMVLSYALCGFAHVASAGIFVGGIAGLAPRRRDDLAALSGRALVGATLATLMTGAVAGMLYHRQPGVLGAE